MTILSILAIIVWSIMVLNMVDIGFYANGITKLITLTKQHYLSSIIPMLSNYISSRACAFFFLWDELMVALGTGLAGHRDLQAAGVTLLPDPNLDKTNIKK